MLLFPKKLILPLLLVLSIPAKAEPFGAISYLTPSEQPQLIGTPPSIKWFGAAGKIYSIEWSSDLLTWNSSSQTYTGNNTEFSVPLTQISSNPPSEKCFFRTKIQFEAADSDFDGLANAWEMHFFGNTSQGANDDWDEDGISNGDESRNNGNPTDPTDGLNRPELVTRSLHYYYEESIQEGFLVDAYEVIRVRLRQESLILWGIGGGVYRGLRA